MHFFQKKFDFRHIFNLRKMFSKIISQSKLFDADKKTDIVPFLTN